MTVLVVITDSRDEVAAASKSSTLGSYAASHHLPGLMYLKDPTNVRASTAVSRALLMPKSVSFTRPAAGWSRSRIDGACTGQQRGSMRRDIQLLSSGSAYPSQHSVPGLTCRAHEYIGWFDVPVHPPLVRQVAQAPQALERDAGQRCMDAAGGRRGREMAVVVSDAATEERCK